MRSEAISPKSLNREVQKGVSNHHRMNVTCICMEQKDTASKNFQHFAFLPAWGCHEYILNVTISSLALRSQRIQMQRAFIFLWFFLETNIIGRDSEITKIFLCYFIHRQRIESIVSMLHASVKFPKQPDGDFENTCT